MFGTIPPIPPPFGASSGNLGSPNVNRVDTMPATTDPINTMNTTNVSQSVVDENLPQLLDSRGGSHVTNVPTFEKEDFMSWKVRFLVFLDGLEPYILKTLADGPFVPMSCLSTSENPLSKHQNQWAFMEIAEDEPSVGKDDARSGQWVDITMKKVHKLLSMTDGDERKHVLDYTHIDFHYVEDQRKNLVEGKRKSPLKRLFSLKLMNPHPTLAPEITSDSESECDSQEPLPPLHYLIGAATLCTSGAGLICVSDLTLNMADLTLDTPDPKKTRPSVKVSPTYVIKKKTEKSLVGPKPCSNKKAPLHQAPSQEVLKLPSKRPGLDPDYLKRCVLKKDGKYSRNVRVKELRSNNGTKFRNYKLEEFCDKKVENSLNNSGEWAVNTACYTQNRSIIMQRHGNTSYDVFRGRSLDISYFHVFGCPVHIHNHMEHLGKFDKKADDGFFLGYSLVAKAFRVFNIRSKKWKGKEHVIFSEFMSHLLSTPNVMHSTSMEKVPF
ncbi:retrovirus-related pol polyprotein from transposon TNT 1-94 [Tanacetum coccineum]